MAFITIGEARKRGMTPPNTTSARVLKEEAGTLRKSAACYDIFLSHSFSDAALVFFVASTTEALKKPASSRSRATHAFLTTFARNTSGW